MGERAKCMKCESLAVWELVPSGSYGEYCDECVPRGCSCNRRFNPETESWDGSEETDERGRLLPCCEYEFQENGFTPRPTNYVEIYRLTTVESIEKRDPQRAAQLRQAWGM